MDNTSKNHQEASQAASEPANSPAPGVPSDSAASSATAPAPASGHGIDRRLVYILPSLLALCLSIAALLFVFSSELFDLQNIRYCVYIAADSSNPDTDTDAECLEIINQAMVESGLTGFTVNKSIEGGFIDDTGTLQTQPSYQIVFLDAQKTHAEAAIKGLRDAFGVDIALVEQMVIESYYVTDKGTGKTVSEAYGG